MITVLRRHALVLGLGVISFAAAPRAASSSPALLDVVICIEASADLRAPLELLRASAPLLLSNLFGGGDSVRVGLVAFSTAGGAPRVDVVPLTSDRQSLARALAALPLRGDAGGTAGVKSALLAALRGGEIGDWRPAAAKVVVVIGRNGDIDASVMAELAPALSALRGVRVSGLPIGDLTFAGLTALARTTGGAVLPGLPSSEIAEGVSQLVSLGQSFVDSGPDVEGGDGLVSDVMGQMFEAEFTTPGGATGVEVVVFSRDDPAIVIAVGTATTASGGKFVVQTRYGYTAEPVTAGCRLRWFRE